MSDGEVDRHDAQRLPVLDRSRSLVFAERRRKVRAVVTAPADFIAQLIACDLRLDAYRDARRESPETGLRRYRAQKTADGPVFEVSV